MAALLYRGEIAGGNVIFITAAERRSVFRLLNVSEAARHLGIPVQDLYYGIRVGRIRRPSVRLGKRWYYQAEDLPILAEQFERHP